jgi:hypothetical protein
MEPDHQLNLAPSSCRSTYSMSNDYLQCDDTLGPSDLPALNGSASACDSESLPSNMQEKMNLPGGTQKVILF